MSKYLDNTGVSYLWGKIKTALANKQDKLTAGQGINITDNQIKVNYDTATTIEDYDSGDWHIRKWPSGYVEMSYAASNSFLLPDYVKDAEHPDGWIEFGVGTSEDKRFIYVRVTDGGAYPITLTKLYSLNASVTIDPAKSDANYSVWLTPDKVNGGGTGRLTHFPPYLVWRPAVIPSNSTYIRLNLYITGSVA